MTKTNLSILSQLRERKISHKTLLQSKNTSHSPKTLCWGGNSAIPPKSISHTFLGGGGIELWFLVYGNWRGGNMSQWNLQFSFSSIFLKKISFVRFFVASVLRFSVFDFSYVRTLRRFILWRFSSKFL